MLSIFDRCRGIPASEAARREGIQLNRRGSREWACCPFHGEKTASMMFDENGKWHCFGCNQGGDAVAFLAILHNLKPYEAAQRLLGEYGENLPAAGSTRRDAWNQPARMVLETWRHHEWLKAFDALCAAEADMDTAREKLLDAGFPEENVWDDPVFCEAFIRKSAARIRLYRLDTRDARELMEFYFSDTENSINQTIEETDR